MVPLRKRTHAEALLHKVFSKELNTICPLYKDFVYTCIELIQR